MDEETWAQCYVPIAKYSVSTTGRVRNDKTSKLLKPSITASGYGYVNLTHDGQKGAQRKYYAHRLLAECHLPNPDKLPSVDHINRDKLDNRITNLRWCSASDQIRNQIWEGDRGYRRPVHQFTVDGTIVKTWSSCREVCSNMGFDEKSFSNAISSAKNLGGFTWHYGDVQQDCDITDEWKEVSIEHLDRRTFVSSRGAVKKQMQCGKYRVCKSAHNGGYLRLCLRINGTGKMFFVHRLVAMTFVQQVDRTHVVVNHKDGNKLNNDATNLEWTTYQANSQHASENGMLGCCRKVDKLDFAGNYIQSYNSITSAMKSVNQKSVSSILNVIAGRQKTTAGFKWRYSMS